MPSHPKVPNSSEGLELIYKASRIWMGALIQLSWAHERPGTGPVSGTKVFEEELLLARVKSCKVTGRRDEGGSISFSLLLGVDTDQYFAHSKIDYLNLSLNEDTAIVYFRTVAGINQDPDRVKIERIS